MKRLLLVLMLFASLSIDAQIVTTFAKNVTEYQSEGVLYYLPRNVIRLEFTVEKTEYFIGPYAEFASKMLGTTDYVKENKSVFNIKNVDIQLLSEADPNAAYYISVDEKSKEPLPNIILDEEGVLVALGYDNISRVDNDNCLNNNKLSDCIMQKVSFIEILDSEIELDDDDDEEEGRAPKKITKEDKAKVALDHIAKIRTAYFDLISGVSEVNYGNTMNIMTENMKNLENEYISLFKGKSVKSTYKKVVFYVPEDNQVNASVTIAKMSNTDGFVDVAGKGETIKIQFENRNTLANINPMSDEAKNESQNNKIFYRIPANADVKVLLGNEVLAEKQMNISQFGMIKTISAKGNKILLNPKTGQVISIINK